MNALSLLYIVYNLVLASRIAVCLKYYNELHFKASTHMSNASTISVVIFHFRLLNFRAWFEVDSVDLSCFCYQ